MSAREIEVQLRPKSGIHWIEASLPSLSRCPNSAPVPTIDSNAAESQPSAHASMRRLCHVDVEVGNTTARTFPALARGTFSAMQLVVKGESNSHMVQDPSALLSFSECGDSSSKEALDDYGTLRASDTTSRRMSSIKRPWNPVWNTIVPLICM